MKKALVLMLLLGLLVTGCQQASTTERPLETLSQAPSFTPTPEPTPLTPAPTIFHAVPTPPVTPSPTLMPTPTPTPTPSPSPTPTPSPTPEPTPFTIVWMSDTQNYSRNNPQVFNSMRDWILNNREAQNIQFVVHTGDVIDGISQQMFDNAAEAMVPIFKALPGMVVSGNHDVSKNKNQWLFICRPYARLVQKKGQTFQDGAAAYVTFRGGDTDFLVFGVGYDVICSAWMNRIIAKHPNHVVIVVVHRGLQETGAYSREAKAIFDDVMPKNPNFRLILCGHQRGSMTRTEWFDDDGDGEKERSVNTLMFNYQDDRTDGLGYMRLLRFNSMTHNIEVLTYSPWFDQWGYPKAKEEENHFILQNAW